MLTESDKQWIIKTISNLLFVTGAEVIRQNVETLAAILAVLAKKGIITDMEAQGLIDERTRMEEAKLEGKANGQTG